jgi:ABC-type amino acid transport substrate-binding protein
MRHVLPVLLALLLCACGKAEEITVLRVAAANEARYPYLYWDENGECAGLEADIARRLAEAMGLACEFIPYSPGDVAQAVREGFADIGCACFESTGRRAGLLETACYYARRPFVLTRRGETYPNEKAMQGFSILCDGVYQYTFATVTDMDTCVARLLGSTADAVICDEFAALSAVDASGETLAAELYRSGSQGLLTGVVNADNVELFTLINGEIERLASEGEIARMAAGYLSPGGNGNGVF